MTFDDELGVALKELTTPRTAPLDARAQVRARLAARRRGRLTAFVGAGTLLVAGVAGVVWTQHRTDAIDVTNATPVRAQVDARSAGPRLRLRFQFPEDRQVTSGEFIVDGHHYQAVFFAEDGTEPVWPVVPLPVDGGVGVSAYLVALPDCGKDIPSQVVLDVASRLSAGQSQKDRFVVSNPDEYGAAVDEWCAHGVTASVSGSEQQTNGDFSVTLSLVNPGPESVTVVSEELEKDGAQWERASVVVPPSTTARLSTELTLHGTGHGCTSNTPWAEGKLTSDGVPLTLQTGSDEAC